MVTLRQFLGPLDSLELEFEVRLLRASSHSGSLERGPFANAVRSRVSNKVLGSLGNLPGCLSCSDLVGLVTDTSTFVAFETRQVNFFSSNSFLEWK